MPTLRPVRPSARPSRRALRAGPTAALVLVSSLALAGCAGGQELASGEPSEAPSGTAEASSTTYPLTLDNCGFDVTFDAAPRKVVTVSYTHLTLPTNSRV